MSPDEHHPHPMMLEISSKQALLDERLRSSIEAMTSHLSALQGDMQGVKNRLEQLTHAQADFTHHSTAVDRLAKAIEKMAMDNERRWEHHERDNKTVADTVNSHRTGIRVSWFAACALAVVLGWFGNSQVSRVRERMDDHLAAGTETKRAYEARFQRLEADVRENKSQIREVKTP